MRCGGQSRVQISGVLRLTGCVHLSDVTYPGFIFSSVKWGQRCLSRRTFLKWSEITFVWELVCDTGSGNLNVFPVQPTLPGVPMAMSTCLPLPLASVGAPSASRTKEQKLSGAVVQPSDGIIGRPEGSEILLGVTGHCGLCLRVHAFGMNTSILKKCLLPFLQCVK